MKIDRLRTLSQFVDYIFTYDFSDIIKKNHSAADYKLLMVYCYNEFLKQSLTKEMFVNPHGTEKPKNNRGFAESDEKYYERLEQWEEAEKKVIFKGFKKRKWDKGVVYDNDELDIFIDLSEHATLYDLANGELETKNLEI